MQISSFQPIKILSLKLQKDYFWWTFLSPVYPGNTWYDLSPKTLEVIGLFLFYVRCEHIKAINNKSTPYPYSFVGIILWLLPWNSSERSANPAPVRFSEPCGSLNLSTITNKQCCAWELFCFLESTLKFLRRGT